MLEFPGLETMVIPFESNIGLTIFTMSFCEIKIVRPSPSTHRSFSIARDSGLKARSGHRP
jgi:hypothetical protein